MTVLTRLRFLTAGESHGPRLTAILEGIPAGFPIDVDWIDADLARRQKTAGAGGRMRIESDRATLSAGVVSGKTTGGPIAVEIPNRDYKNWKDADISPMTVPRPGHADLSGAIKYGHPDLRLSLERASARETAARVAVGAICRQILDRLGIAVGGYVRRIGSVTADLAEHPDLALLQQWVDDAKASDLSCPDPTAADAMREAIDRARQSQDTLGGVIDVVVLGVPPGLGSYAHWDRRLEATLAMAVMSIQAIKGVEIGPAFENAGRSGTEVHDEIFLDKAGHLTRRTNRCGGIEGGMTTSAPIVVRAAMKPISTTLNPRKSVDLSEFTPSATTYERSDICALPRAVVVAEAMVAIVVADALLEKLGGDSLGEIEPRLAELSRGEQRDFNLDNAPWRFGYRD
ncbi:MAG: chorismate synthase [Myxococcota bacterium]|nr:chorismate synthase [Myxococcota bacterium]